MTRKRPKNHGNGYRIQDKRLSTFKFLMRRNINNQNKSLQPENTNTILTFILNFDKKDPLKVGIKSG